MNPPSRSIDNRNIRYLPVAQFHHVYPLFHADQILEILGPQQQKAHNDSSFHCEERKGIERIEGEIEAIDPRGRSMYDSVLSRSGSSARKMRSMPFYAGYPALSLKTKPFRGCLPHDLRLRPSAWQ